MKSKAHTTIGKIIKHHREIRGMTQMELATKLGYDSPQFVSLFERGFSKVPAETLGLLITLLELPEDKIFNLLITEHAEDLKRNLKAGKRQGAGLLSLAKSAS